MLVQFIRRVGVHPFNHLFPLLVIAGEAFDLVFLDWVLLQKTRFFQHYYPETEGCAGYHSYGFNKKSQITKIILFPFVSALIAWLCIVAF